MSSPIDCWACAKTAAAARHTRLVWSAARSVASHRQLNILSISSQPDLDFVIEGDRLHDRPEIVEAVGAAVEDAQDQVDFGRSEDSDVGSVLRWINHDLP